LLSVWRKKERLVEVEPYSRLAPVYDYLMRHVNYARWATYVIQIFSVWGAPMKSVLDIACGTGSFILELHHRGYTVAGLDRSLAMVEVAGEKLRGRAIPVWCGEMQAFAVRSPLDAVVCLYDSINYLMALEDYERTLHAASTALKEGGLFIFDICTERNSIRNFDPYYEVGRSGRFRYARWSSYDPRERIHTNRFEIGIAGDPVEYEEIHRQRIFSINEVKGVIESSVFTCLGIYDGFSMTAGSEKSNRVHFVLRK